MLNAGFCLLLLVLIAIVVLWLRLWDVVCACQFVGDSREVCGWPGLVRGRVAWLMAGSENAASGRLAEVQSSGCFGTWWRVLDCVRSEHGLRAG